MAIGRSARFASGRTMAWGSTNLTKSPARITSRFVRHGRISQASARAIASCFPRCSRSRSAGVMLSKPEPSGRRAFGANPACRERLVSGRLRLRFGSSVTNRHLQMTSTLKDKWERPSSLVARLLAHFRDAKQRPYAIALVSTLVLAASYSYLVTFGSTRLDYESEGDSYDPQADYRVDCENDDFSQTTSFWRLPNGMRDVLGGSDMSSPGGSFESSDVGDGPRRRFVMAAVGQGHIFAAVEQGGVGYGVEIGHFGAETFFSGLGTACRFSAATRRCRLSNC